MTLTHLDSNERIHILIILFSLHVNRHCITLTVHTLAKRLRDYSSQIITELT